MLPDDGAGAGDDALAHPDPAAAFGVLLHLSYLRSVFVVGQALWLQYPDEPSWLAALGDPVFRGAVSGFASLVMDLKARAAAGWDPEQLVRLAEREYGPMLASLSALADALGVDAGDLLAVLVHT
jgi:hypothetical protein